MNEPPTPASPSDQDTSSMIPKEIDGFIRQIEALKISIKFAVGMVHFMGKKENDEFKAFLDSKGTLQSEDDEAMVYAVGPSAVGEAARRRRRVERFQRAYDILPRSFLISLISQYDFFLGSILRCLYYLKPDLMNSSDRVLSFAQLVEAQSVENARELLIEKEVETLLRKSHIEQFEWLENKFNISLREGLPSWSTFVEATQRRNLFTHCNGIVSTQYMNVCGKQRITLDGIKLGTSLDCSPSYFQSAYECIFEVGVKLAQVLWRKIRPDQISAADDNIMNISYELLLSEEYALLIRLLEFVTQKLKKFSSDEIRRILTINYALAHKWSGDESTCEQIITKEDWSASAYKFQLAVAVLRNNFDLAAELVRKIGKDGEVSEQAYKEWPLFREFRQSKQFLDVYQKTFGVDFASTERITGSSLSQDGDEQPDEEQL